MSFAAPREEEMADTVSIGEYLLGRKEVSYILQIESEFMTHRGLMPGDSVIFERGREPGMGDIAVLLGEDGYMLREYAALCQGKVQGRIIGVVTASFRKYH